MVSRDSQKMLSCTELSSVTLPQVISALKCPRSGRGKCTPYSDRTSANHRSVVHFYFHTATPRVALQLCLLTRPCVYCVSELRHILHTVRIRFVNIDNICIQLLLFTIAFFPLNPLCPSGIQDCSIIQRILQAVPPCPPVMSRVSMSS